MNTTFWIGLAIGDLLSLLASIAANLFHTQITKFLEDRKLASQSNRFAKAADFHRLVTELHTGERDKYHYMMRLSARLVIGATISFILVTAALVAIVLIQLSSFDQGNQLVYLPFLACCFGLALTGC